MRLRKNRLSIEKVGGGDREERTSMEKRGYGHQ